MTFKVKDMKKLKLVKLSRKGSILTSEQWAIIKRCLDENTIICPDCLETFRPTKVRLIDKNEEKYGKHRLFVHLDWDYYLK